jgi:PAS domain S-box-containing protein
MDQSMDVICTIDREGHFVDVGAASEAIWGYTPEELEGTQYLDLVFAEDVENTQHVAELIMDGRDMTNFENRYVRKDGAVVHIIWSARWDEEDELMYCVARDATAMKRQQKKLLEVNERFRYVSKATSDVIWDWDIQNNSLYRGQGAGSLEYMGRMEDWIEHIHPGDRERVKQSIFQLIDDHQKNTWEESYRFEKFDKAYAYIQDRGFVIRSEDGQAIRMVGAMHDISEFKERENRIRNYQKVISELATNKELVQMDLADALTAVIKKSAETLGVERANVWLLNGENLRCVADCHLGEEAKLRGAVLTKEDYPKYFEQITKHRTIVSSDARKDDRLQELHEGYFKEHNVYSLLDTSVQTYGEMQAVVCHESVGKKHKWRSEEVSFAGSITDQVAQLLANDEKNKREQELKKSLKEKEILLGEVHHRVKNNLAVISGMMQLQAFEEEDEIFRSKLMDSVTRISSMATIHEQLYQSENFSELDFSSNLKRLVASIIETIQLNTEITTKFSIEDVQLNINQAIPCSLIVNEVLTNIVKHAFIGESKGKILISLSEVDCQIDLRIKDNGGGLPDGFDAEKSSETLGLKIIKTLSAQLEADFTYQSNGSGTTFRLSFQRGKLRGIGNARL